MSVHIWKTSKEIATIRYGSPFVRSTPHNSKSFFCTNVYQCIWGYTMHKVKLKHFDLLHKLKSVPKTTYIFEAWKMIQTLPVLHLCIEHHPICNITCSIHIHRRILEREKKVTNPLWVLVSIWRLTQLMYHHRKKVGAHYSNPKLEVSVYSKVKGVSP